MPHYICRLAAEDGRLLRESLLAPSREECRRHFESRGYGVLSIKRDWGKLNVSLSSLSRKVGDKEFLLFNQELMSLLRAGYPVLKSLELVIHRTRNQNLKEILLRVAESVRSGKTLSEAFSPFESLFSTVYIASLLAGEQGGTLPQSLGRYADYARRIAKTKARIRSAMLYPSVLLAFSFTLLLILVNFILPRFSGFYEDFEAELPPVTRLLMGFAAVLRTSMPFLLLAAVLLAVLVVWLRRRAESRVWLDRVKLSLPYGRHIWLETGVSLFARTLGLLIGAGITLLQSILIAVQAVPNRYLARKMSGVADRIRNGLGLSDSLAQAGLFPDLALDMIRIGETSANLEGLLAETAEVYEDKVQARVDNFVSLVEPVLIIFMGLVAAVMLLSVYLPIFNIIKITR